VIPRRAVAFAAKLGRVADPTVLSSLAQNPGDIRGDFDRKLLKMRKFQNAYYATKRLFCMPARTATIPPKLLTFFVN